MRCGNSLQIQLLEREREQREGEIDNTDRRDKDGIWKIKYLNLLNLESLHLG